MVSMASPEPAADLAGLRVLITRPQQQAIKWQQLLQRHGAQTVAIPLLSIAPLDQGSGPAVQAIKSLVMNLDHYQHAIFVSQNAAQYGTEWIDQYWPQIPLGVKFYAVGSATAQRLQHEGLDVTAAAGTMNSEALLKLPELQQLDQQKVLIFRGVGGRSLLADTLRQRGARVDYCELYQRLLPKEAGEALEQLTWCRAGDVIALHSGETLLNLCKMIQSLANDGKLNISQWQQVPLLVPGERVYRTALDQGFSQIITAENASDSSMLEALLHWHSTR